MGLKIYIRCGNPQTWCFLVFLERGQDKRMVDREHESSLPFDSDGRDALITPRGIGLLDGHVFVGVEWSLSLQTVLLPFVAGAAIAYFLDPVADWLEGHGFSRTTATVLITALFLIVIVGILLLLLPALQAEILGFVNRIPAYAQAISERLKPALASITAVLPGCKFRS